MATVPPGLSDFHKLVLTVLKASIAKSITQKITYRDLKIVIRLGLMKS